MWKPADSEITLPSLPSHVQVQVSHEAGRKAGLPDGAIGWMQTVTLEGTQELMKAREVSVILATGGMGLVRAAYSAGKPAYGVGPGNAPVRRYRRAVDFSELKPRVPEPPERELHPIVLPTPNPIAVGAGAGCFLVAVAPLVGFALVKALSLPVRHGLVVTLIGSVPLVPLIGWTTLGTWGEGTLRAGAVMALAWCACGGTLFTPIEGQLLPSGLAGACSTGSAIMRL